MRHRFDSGGLRHRNPLRRAAIALALACSGILMSATAASAVVVYDNIPSPPAGNYPSKAFQATQTSQFGGQIGLAGTERQDPNITITMSSWACQSDPNPTCTTTPGATFAHPITLNLYSVLPSGQPEGLIARVTQTFNIPFRPSQSAVCGDRRWSQDGTAATCFNGFANNITFNLAGRGISLPDRVIVALAYNTQMYGENPIGTDGPYNSLNVGLTGPPTVGSLPRADDAYLHSATAGQYCDGGTGGTNVFRLDAGCWGTAPGAGDRQPMIEVDANTTGGTPGATGPAGPIGPIGATGPTGSSSGTLGQFQAKKKCKKGKRLKKGKCVRKKK